MGTKTVGVALSDELGITAQALTVVRRQNLKQDLAQLQTIATQYEVNTVIVGLPLNMDGSEGPRAEASRAFGKRVETQLSVPIVYWDERLSTVAAQRVLLEADLSRAKRKKVVDQVAAAYILQGWLDSQVRPEEYDT